MTTIITQPIAASTDAYRITPARLWEIRALYHLEHLAFGQDAYSYPEMTILFMPGMVNLKAVNENGEIVGFISGGRLLGWGRTWIMSLGVHPAHQRRGLGRKLLTACEERLSDPMIYLTVRTSNTGAIALYASNGYRRFALKPRYYPGGEDGIEMRKERFDRR